MNDEDKWWNVYWRIGNSKSGTKLVKAKTKVIARINAKEDISKQEITPQNQILILRIEEIAFDYGK